MNLYLTMASRAMTIPNDLQVVTASGHWVSLRPKAAPPDLRPTTDPDPQAAVTRDPAGRVSEAAACGFVVGLSVVVNVKGRCLH